MEYQDLQSKLHAFADHWPVDGSYYIWGASTTARKLYGLFGDKLNIVGYVDSDSRKWGTQFQGRSVLSPEEFLAKRGDVRCIIASVAYGEIAYELERKRLREGTCFCNGWCFIGIHRYLEVREVHLRRVDLSITSYCNLRCRHCNMLIPYHQHRRHYSMEDILTDVDAYFHWVDGVHQFNILGGEPFLHPEVRRIAEEIAGRYRDRIGSLSFFSNGTVLPDENVLELMEQYRIRVDIGDYRTGVPAIRSKVERFIRALETHGIDYSLPAAETWLDFNHTPEDRTEWEAEKLVTVCKRCRQPFRGIHDQKLYFCHLNTSAVLAGLYPEEPGDSFDLSGPAEGRKGALLAYDLACFPKGYVSYCRHCGGCGPANQQTVPVAEQLPAGYQGRP